MLLKNYSTAAILMAANVVDGGKSINDVPDSFLGDVTDLVQSLVSDAKPVTANTPTVKAATDDTGLTQTVAIEPKAEA